jgi:hypothetical protein
MLRVLSLIFILLLAGCASSDTRAADYTFLVDRLMFASLFSKSKTQIEDKLGKPETITQVNLGSSLCPCDKMTYLGGKVEIVFANGKADQISLHRSTGKVDFYGILPPPSEQQ